MAAAGVALWRGMGAHAVPASELWLSPAPVLGTLPRALLIATSRSGETSETVRAVERFRQLGGQGVIVITCEPRSRLAEGADVTLAVPAAREQSLAQTRSFASFLLLAQAVIDGIAGDGTFPDRLKSLPDLGRRLIEAHADTIAALGKRLDLQRFFFLGTGPCYGLANEGMLKLKEMSCTPCETYHTLEFRHGPMTLIDRSTLVTALISDHARAEEVPLLREIRRLGTETLTFAEAGDGEPRDALDHPIVLHSGLPYLDRLVLYLPFLQLLGYHRAMAKGVDADRPRHLKAYVALESAHEPQSL
jgi:glucosamine--fructose-6-phosphate aminotransferase (isomerizing)